MKKVKFWFLNVGHGDCSYIELSNGARIMIDCGCGPDHWPSTLLKYFKITANDNPVEIPNDNRRYGIDKLIITHPHGDHIADICAIHDDVRFYWLLGHYYDFIDKIVDRIDFGGRNKEAVEKFVEVVKSYTAGYDESRDRTAHDDLPCIIRYKRFLGYEDGMNLNDLSFLVSFTVSGQKVLYMGDMSASGVRKILGSDMSQDFRDFVKGTTILKVPHHGREDACSDELFEAFGCEPLLCVISDEALNSRNENTSSTGWYSSRTSSKYVYIDGELKSRAVLTTRKDKDICITIDESGSVSVATRCLEDIRAKII